MSNCLGIYAQDNIIKYAKLTTNKDGGGLQLASYGVRFGDDTRSVIEQIINETNSKGDVIATNIAGERYLKVEVFSKLKQKDTKELIQTDFNSACDAEGITPSVLEMRYRLIKNTGDQDKFKVLCASTYKSEITKLISDFSDYKLGNVSPIGTSITNILPNKGVEEQAAVITIEDNTVVTVLQNGEIVDAQSFDTGMAEVISKLTEKYNSVAKAYESCKGVSAYIEDIYSLEEENREVLDLLIPMLYELRLKIQKYLEPYMPLIKNIYITGTGVIVNNVDLYFSEVFTDKVCQTLTPYFIGKDASNLKDVTEVNSAIAIAFNGLGFGDDGLNFLSSSSASKLQFAAIKKKAEDLVKKTTELTKNLKEKVNEKVSAKTKKNKIDIDFNDEVVGDIGDDTPNITDEQLYDSVEEDKAPTMTAFDWWLVRVAGALFVSIVLYSLASLYTADFITTKKQLVADNQAKVNASIATAKEDQDSILYERDRYDTMKNRLQEMLDKVTTRSVSFDIPNFMSKLMFVIPENVQVTQINVSPIPTNNPLDKEIESVSIKAESGQYAQLGYFVSRLKLDGVLKNVDMVVDSMNDKIKISINGELP